MKSSDLIYRIDSLGRIFLPKDIRKELKWERTTPLILLSNKYGVFVRKYENVCLFCGTKENLQTFENKSICQVCMARLQKANEISVKFPYI